jgi:hypothetical protein
MLLQPQLEAVALLRCPAVHCHAADAGWDCMAHLAACHCCAGEAAWFQLLQDTVQSWSWQLQDVQGLMCTDPRGSPEVT